jgi:hypothetical protein
MEEMEMSETIISVAYFAETEEIRNAVLQSDTIRRRTLKACYEIPGYEALPLSDKNRAYDAVKSLPADTVITGSNIAERFGSTWVHVHHTISPEMQKQHDLIYPHRILSIRLMQSEQDKGPSVLSYADTGKSGEAQ